MADVTVGVEFRTVGNRVERDAQRIKKRIDDIVTANQLMGRNARTASEQVRSAFVRQAKAINDTRTKYNEVIAKAKQLGISTSQLSSELGVFNSSMKRAALTGSQFAAANNRMSAVLRIYNDEIKRASSENIRNSSTVERVSQAQVRAAGTTDRLSAAQRRASGEANAFNTTLSRVAQQIRLIEGPLGGTAARVSTLAAMFRAAVSPMGFFVIGMGLMTAGLGLLTIKLFQFQRQLEPTILKLRFAASEVRKIDGFLEPGSIVQPLETINNSLANAQKEMAFLIRTTRELGVNLKTSIDSFASFAAAARVSTLSGQEVRDIFEGVSVAISALDLPSEQVGRVFLALEQMISKGRVSMEELRRQLGNAIPGAVEIAASSIGVTTDELFRMVEAGELLAKDLLPAMADEFKRLFSDTAQISTLNKEINRMSAIWFEIQHSLVFRTGLNELFTDLAADLRSILEGLRDFIDDTIDGVVRLINFIISVQNRVSGFLRSQGLRVGPNRPFVSVPPRLSDIDPGVSSRPGRIEAPPPPPDSLTELRKEVANIRVLQRAFSSGGAGALEFTKNFDLPALKAANEVLKEMNQSTISLANGVSSLDNEFAKEAASLQETIELNKEAESIILDNVTARERFNITMDRLNNLHRQGFIDQETFTRAAKKAREELVRNDEVLNRLSNAFSNFGDSIADGVIRGERAIDNLRDAVRGLAEDIARLVFKKAISDPIAEGISSIISGIDFGDIFGFSSSAKGNVFGPKGLQKFAKGGVVSGPTLFSHGSGIGEMGEAGEEAVMPLQRDGRGRLGVIASGGASSTVVVNVVSEVGGEVTATREGNNVTVAIKAVAADIAEGGAVFKAMRKTFQISPTLNRRG